MNIALLTSFFLPDSVGGGETHTLHLAQGLQRLGHTVRVWRVASGAPPSTRDYAHEGIPVEIVPDDASWVAGRLRQHAIDLVHVTIAGRCQRIMTAVAAQGLPMVLTLLDFHYWCPQALRHGDGTLCPGPESREVCHQCLLRTAGRVHVLGPAWRRLPQMLRRATSRLPSVDTLALTWDRLEADRMFFRSVLAARSVFIAPSPIMRRLALDADVPPARIVDLPYGIPAEFVGASRPKTTAPRLRVGYLGRLVADKGVHLLIEAVASLPKHTAIELRLYGSVPQGADDYGARLLALAGGDERIQFCGTIDQRQMPAAHRDLDLVVIPSLWHENATIVLLESRALGTPVLVSDVEGMAAFVDEGRNGFTFPMGDVRALAARLSWCSEHRDLLTEMSQQCQPVQTADSYAKRMEAVYTDLLVN